MISILFEDDDVVVVDKPEGLASIPERSTEKECLLLLLSKLLAQKLLVVHRLDKEVSGIIVFAKNPEAHRCLNDQFCTRAVRKTYLGLAQGVIEQQSGTINMPIRQFGSGRMGIDASRGKRSVTTYQVMKRFEAYTLVSINPITGRRHQIRAHFFGIGHPIAGDLKYGDRAVQRRFPRLMLHAQRIEFRLPTGREMAVDAPVPESFDSFMTTIA